MLKLAIIQLNILTTNCLILGTICQCYPRTRVMRPLEATEEQKELSPLYDDEVMVEEPCC